MIYWVISSAEDIKNGMKVAVVNETDIAKLSLGLFWMPKRESVPPSEELLRVGVCRLRRGHSGHRRSRD